MECENKKLSVKMRLTKVIYWNQAKFGDDAEKPISDDAKKALAEATQLLGSKHVRREVLEKPQEISKDKRKDDTELMDFAAKLNRQVLDNPKSGLVKCADVLKLKMGKSDVWKPDKKPFLEENHKCVNSKTLEELFFKSATVGCGQLQQSGAYPNNEDFNEVCLVTFPTWWTIRRCRVAQVVACTESVEVAAGATQEMAPSSVCGCWRRAADAGQEISPAEVAADLCRTAAPTKIGLLRRRDLHKVGARSRV